MKRKPRVYDTRFFFDHYYSDDKELLGCTSREMIENKEKYTSAIVIHEVYKLSLEIEGREVAELRAKLLEKDFKTINVDPRIAKLSAQLRHRHKIPMADSIIAATAICLNAECVTDDPHYKQIKELKLRWIK